MSQLKLFSVLTACLFCTLILLLASHSVVHADTAPIFSDGFESGNLTAWSGSLGSPTVQSSTVHSGAYALECSSSTGQYVYEDLSSADTLYLRVYVYFSSLPTSGNFLSFSEMKHADNDNDIVVAVYNDSGTAEWAIRHSPWGLPPQAEAGTGPVVGQWYAVELNSTLVGTTVNSELFVDGVSVLNNTWDGGSSNPFVYVQTGGWNMSETLTNYVDDVIVDSSYIGPATALVTLDQTGLALDFSGPVITVDGFNYTLSQLPVSFWWNTGSYHNFTYQSPLVVSADEKQYVWSSTSGTLGESVISDSITINASGTVIGNYGTQYYVTFSQSGVDVDFIGSVMNIDDVNYTSSGYSDWFDSGASVPFNYYSPLVVTPNGEQYVLTGVSGNSTDSTLIVSAATTVTGSYKPQWYITVSSTHGNPTELSQWVDAGSSFSVSVTNPDVVVLDEHQWNLSGLIVDSVTQPLANSVSFASVAANHTVEFDWTEQ